MTQTCAVQELSQDALLLCWAVAMQEDAIRYLRPVTYFTEPLCKALGFAKWDRLNKARSIAVSKGWLHYASQGRTQAGIYYVTVPEKYVAYFEMNFGPLTIPTTGCKTGDKEEGKDGPPDDPIPATGCKTGDKEGDKQRDKDGGTAGGVSSYTVKPDAAADAIPAKTSPDLSDAEHQASSSSSSKNVLSVHHLRLYCYIPELEEETFQQLCDTFTKDFLMHCVNLRRAERLKGGLKRHICLSDLVPCIEAEAQKLKATQEIYRDSQVTA